VNIDLDLAVSGQDEAVMTLHLDSTVVMGPSFGHLSVAKYEDQVRSRMMEKIQQKIDGQEISMPPEEAPESKIIDLMEALKASVGTGGAGRSSAKRAAGKAPAKRKASAKRKPAARAGKAAAGNAAKRGKRKIS